MSSILSVILAAGQGTRMKSDKIKVLHHVGGKPMVQHVVDSITDFSSNIVLVIGHQSEDVNDSLDNKELKYVVQNEQLGTGHAVMQAREQIANHNGPVLVLYGDTPLLREDTLKRFVKIHQKEKAACTVLTALIDNPTGYGRIVKDQEGNITKIVEEKDASLEEKSITEINSGVYCFDSKLLLEALDNIHNNNVQGEYYLTDTISYLSALGETVVPMNITDNSEIIGINDRVNLAKAEKVFRNRINIKHMENGVTIIDPDTTYIDSQVIIGQDTIIYPFTYLEGNTIIGEHCVIAPHSRIIDGELGNYVNIKDHCVVMGSKVGNETNIGPYAYIRPGCNVMEKAKVGDFVELKKAEIGRGSKVPHLSYVGDASIGKETNIGAGTIFANYDGEDKHKTTVGNEVFIGSNTTLIAPLKIYDKAKTGAGSVVTKDIKAGNTVVGVPARVYKKN